MKSDKYISEKECNELIIRVKAGDNEAWEKLYKNYEAYIYSRVKNILLNYEGNNISEIEKDLFQAGWTGFICAIKNYKPKENKFITYATYYIDGEIKKEYSLVLNTLGLAKMPNYVHSKVESVEAAEEAVDDKVNIEITKALLSKECSPSVDAIPVEKMYPAEGRTIQILKILSLLTDEEHSLSKDEIRELLRLYRAAKYGKLYNQESYNTITSTMEQLIEELDPLEYTNENDSDYRIFYEGYKENRFKENQSEKSGKTKSAKAKSISRFSYNHILSHKELDSLIEQICFSTIISEDQKVEMIKKLVSTASVYYKSPFWDGEKLKFNPKAVHGRFDSKKSRNRDQFIKNIAILQEAINNLAQIKFCFNRYNSDGVLEQTSDYIHELSPYHVVVYHDNFYCIGLKKDDKRIWHYRVDLMSDIEIMHDENGVIIPIEVSAFDGLPISNVEWNPEKYMSEHINMAYDEPRDIHIKIKNTDYTILHDWFGNHYFKTDLQMEDGYSIAKVKSSPSMMVHWAMQYSDKVEIIDEDIRLKIIEEIEKISQKYQ